MEIPMNAWSVSEEDIVKALRAIQAAPKPVLVHCQYGADRSGVVLAMYRVVIQNWTKEDALAEMTQGGYRVHWYYFNLSALVKKADVARIREQPKSPQLSYSPDAIPGTFRLLIYGRREVSRKSNCEGLLK